MRTLRRVIAAGLLFGLGCGVVSISGGCDSSPGDGSQVTIDAAAKQQQQDRAAKMKEFMARKTATAHRRR